MLKRGLVAMLILLAPAPSALAAQATSVVMLSDGGDYIGGGVPRWYHPGNAQISVTGSTGYLSVNVSGGNLGDYFNLDFAAPPGQALVPGTYVGAQRAAFREAGRPGIDVSGDGRGCNTIEGLFEVKAFDLDADGTLKRLWIVYEQHCEGGESALFGEVRVGVDAPDGALVSPTVLRWPAADVGRPGPAVPVTVVAAENLTIADASIGGTNAADFAERVDECTGKSLTAGSTCQVYVRPTASGAGVRDAKLTLKDGAGRVHEVALQAFAYGGKTRWHMESDEGDYIGGGKTWDYSPADGDLIAAGGSRQYVGFGVNGADGTYWGATFTPPQGDIIAPGTYEDATRYPFNGTGPGLDVSGEGRGCNQLSGKFTVNSVTFDDDGALRTASVTFEQHCEHMTPALRGTLEYRAGDATPPAPWMVPSGGGGGAPSPFGGRPQTAPATPQSQPGQETSQPQQQAPETARCGTRTYLVSLVISGTDRADRLRGLPRGDMLVAGPGNDRVYGLAGDDCMDGGPGNDRLSGGAGKDLVDGNRGNDLLGGGSGNDVLAGAAGRDRLAGGSGRDVLDGGPGRDRLDCGPGRDVAIRGKGDRYVRCEKIVAAVATASATKRRRSCAKTGNTVLRNSTARVYDVGQRVFACHLRTRRRMFLTRYMQRPDDLEDYEGFIRGRLAGRFVAFGEDFGCSRYGDCGGRVRVVDTRTGADHATAGVTILRGMPNAGRTPSLPALHLRPDGTAAFIIGPANDAAWEVWRLGPGAEQRLDAGNVDPRSMAVNDARIYWMREGQPFSAPWR